MHTRERGAAHVNIFFFLVTLVLFLGAGVFAYVNLEEVTKLRGEVADAKVAELHAVARLEIYKDYVKDVTAAVGMPGEYKGGKDAAGNPKVYNDDGTPVDPIANATNPDLVRAELGEFAKRVKVPDPEGWREGLSALFGHVVTKQDGLLTQIADLQSQIKGRDARIASLETANSEATAALQSQTADLNTMLTQRAEEHQAAIDDKDTLVKNANAEVSRRRDQLLAEQEAHQADNLQNAKDKEILQGQIAAISDKVSLINPPQAADGMVLESSQAAGAAWINLGRRDMLAPGTVFRITAPGADTVKAWGTVTKVLADRAEIRVTGLADRFDPVVGGDRISNDLYSPNLRRNVYLMGRFSHPYSKPMVKALLESLGNTVVDKVGPGVDLVIVGGNEINEDGSGFAPIEESEDYQKAQFLRIETVALHKVRSFLQVSE